MKSYIRSGKGEKIAHHSGGSWQAPALEMVKTILGIEAEKKLQRIPLSEHVIPSNIDDVSADILDQVVLAIKASAVSLPCFCD